MGLMLTLTLCDGFLSGESKLVKLFLNWFGLFWSELRSLLKNRLKDYEYHSLERASLIHGATLHYYYTQREGLGVRSSLGSANRGVCLGM